MTRSSFYIISCFSLLTISGCSFASDTLFPPVTEPDNPTQINNVQTSDAAYSEEKTQNINKNVIPVTPQKQNNEYTSPYQKLNLETVPGKKVATLKSELNSLQNTINKRADDLASLRDKISDDASRYHETVAFINSKLQVGTTPGNPIMVENWYKAVEQLENLNQDVIALGQLASQVTSDSAMTSYLLDSVRATYSLSGAVDQDHRNLRRLEDETNQTSILIERLLSEINNDVTRQQQYVANERKNINTLSLAIRDGQLYGNSLSDPLATAGNMLNNLSAAPGTKASYGSLPLANVDNRKPLMTIRFDRRDVSYEQALYQTAKRALERNPDVIFDVVAVTPSASGVAAGVYDARRYAENVMRSLVKMGFPANRIKLSAMGSSKAKSSEVLIFVR